MRRTGGCIGQCLRAKQPRLFKKLSMLRATLQDIPALYVYGMVQTFEVIVYMVFVRNTQNTCLDVDAMPRNGWWFEDRWSRFGLGEGDGVCG